MKKKPEILKEDALALYPTLTALADALGITKGAVSQWEDGKPIPEKQALMLRYVVAPRKVKLNS